MPIAKSIFVVKTTKKPNAFTFGFEAEDEIRTRDVHLGKVTLYH